MRSPAHDVEPIPVVVTLRPPLEQFAAGTDSAAFTAQLREQLAEVVADLGLPASIALTVTAATNIESTTGPPYTISINSQPARLPLVLQDENEATATALSRRIGDAVRRRRTMLLPAAICEHIRRKWALESGIALDAIPGEVVGRWVSRLVAVGARIDRTMPVAALRAVATGGMAALRPIEEVIPSSPTIGVRVGPRLYDRLRQPGIAGKADADGDDLYAHLHRLSCEVYTELGLVIDPPVVVRDHGLTNEQFRLQLNDLRWAPHEASRQDGDLSPDRATVVAIVAATRHLVAMHAPCLMTKATVCQLLDLLREREPALVDAVLSRFDPTVITWILQDLLEDRIPVRDFRNILEALASVEGMKFSANAMGDSVTTADIEYSSNWVRAEFTRQIMDSFMVGSALVVHLLTPDLEARIVESDLNPMSDAERQRLVDLVLTAWRAQASGPMIVLTTVDVKRRLRRLIADELPDVRVIHYLEVDPSANIAPRARIGADAQG
jgi:hypothetical protein